MTPPDLAVLCTLPQELGTLGARASSRRRVLGLELLELDLAGRRVLACACGVGKVRAAHGASLLLEAGASALLVVGTCGGLRRGLGIGTLVHCEVAFQTDLAVRELRQVQADARLRGLWQEVAPGPSGWFLTADRPVLSPWRRLRLARAFSGPCVADMETAAAAAVAHTAGVPFAALRAVTDRAGIGAGATFKAHFSTQAGRAADTIEELSLRLDADQGPGSGFEDQAGVRPQP